jgi:hypothetical protein
LQGNPGLPGERGETGPRVSKLAEVMNSHTKEKVQAQHFDVCVTSDSAIIQPGFFLINCPETIKLLTYVPTDILSFKFILSLYGYVHFQPEIYRNKKNIYLL